MRLRTIEQQKVRYEVSDLITNYCLSECNLNNTLGVIIFIDKTLNMADIKIDILQVIKLVNDIRESDKIYSTVFSIVYRKYVSNL